MMGKKYYGLFLFSILIIGFSYQNCSPLKGKGDTVSNFSANEEEDATFSQVKALLDSRCVVCHGEDLASGGISFESYIDIMDSETVIPGNAEGSPLYTSVFDGSMPQGLPSLNPAELEIIRQWIDSGAPSSSGDLVNELPQISMPQAITIKLPVDFVLLEVTVLDLDGQIVNQSWSQLSGPSNATLSGAQNSEVLVSNLVAGTYAFQFEAEDNRGAIARGNVIVTVQPGTGIVPGTETPQFRFSSDVQPILNDYCVTCHREPNPSKQLALQTYSQVMESVTSGSANTSPLYLEVLTESMPRGGVGPLSQEQKDKIGGWINQGALNN